MPTPCIDALRRVATRRGEIRRNRLIQNNL